MIDRLQRDGEERGVISLPTATNVRSVQRSKLFKKYLGVLLLLLLLLLLVCFFIFFFGGGGGCLVLVVLFLFLFFVCVCFLVLFFGGFFGGFFFCVSSYISGVHHFLGEIFAYVTVFLIQPLR